MFLFKVTRELSIQLTNTSAPRRVSKRYALEQPAWGKVGKKKRGFFLERLLAPRRETLMFLRRHTKERARQRQSDLQIKNARSLAPPLLSSYVVRPCREFRKGRAGRAGERIVKKSLREEPRGPSAVPFIRQRERVIRSPGGWPSSVGDLSTVRFQAPKRGGY